MSKTRIFLSSTCYDLAAVRESLREHILLLGHDPILSEFSSFPVNPDATAIENCKTNVQKNTDILILIIGGRRGALDLESGKSVTNAEYERARVCGIPCFVFINRSVVSLFHVWKKNPTADFTPTVDCPEVFEFISRIQKENQWTFTFDKTAEIKETLSLQLSNLLQDLIERSRQGKLTPYVDFARESLEAQRLARDKPEYWEFFLTAELLTTRLRQVRKRFARQQVGDIRKPLFIMTGRQFIKWVPAKIADMHGLASAMHGQLKEIQAAWGLPGQPGDPVQIKNSIDQLVAYCDQLLDWELDLCAARPPDPVQGAKESMKGWTEVILLELERLPEELLRPFADGAKPKGEINIMLTPKAPSMENFMKEFELLKNQNARDWLNE